MRRKRPPFGGVSGRPSDSQTEKGATAPAFSARSLGRHVTNIRNLQTGAAETIRVPFHINDEGFVTIAEKHLRGVMKLTTSKY
jgi:hypothetical protein